MAAETLVKIQIEISGVSPLYRSTVLKLKLVEFGFSTIHPYNSFSCPNIQMKCLKQPMYHSK